MDMQFWNDSASLFHCGMSSLSLFSLLWQPALGESVTKVPPTCPSPAQKQGLFPFISSLLHPQNILATSIICVGHDSLRGLISFYYLCKLSICSWISLSSPALWCYSLFIPNLKFSTPILFALKDQRHHTNILAIKRVLCFSQCSWDVFSSSPLPIFSAEFFILSFISLLQLQIPL